MGNSGIPYLDKVYNPVLGCSPKMPCAARCWAAGRVAAWAVNPRMRHTAAGPAIQTVTDSKGWSGRSALVESWLDAPLHWRKPQRIGVCFLGDLFAEAVPDEWIGRVLNICASARQHRYYFLTKQADRMRDAVRDWFGPGLGGYGSPTPELARLMRDSLWFGASVCNQDEFTARVDGPLVELAFAGWHTWCSIEPMIGGVNYEIRNAPLPEWCVVGCESGPGRRPMPWSWAQSIVAQCKAANVPCYVKQLDYRSESPAGVKYKQVIHPGMRCWPDWAKQEQL